MVSELMLVETEVVVYARDGRGTSPRIARETLAKSAAPNERVATD